MRCCQSDQVLLLELLVFGQTAVSSSTGFSRLKSLALFFSISYCYSSYGYSILMSCYLTWNTDYYVDCVK